MKPYTVNNYPSHMDGVSWKRNSKAELIHETLEEMVFKYLVVTHNEKEYENEYGCICMTETLCCTPEVDTL